MKMYKFIVLFALFNYASAEDSGLLPIKYPRIFRERAKYSTEDFRSLMNDTRFLLSMGEDVFNFKSDNLAMMNLASYVGLVITHDRWLTTKFNDKTRYRWNEGDDAVFYKYECHWKEDSSEVLETLHIRSHDCGRACSSRNDCTHFHAYYTAKRGYCVLLRGQETWGSLYIWTPAWNVCGIRYSSFVQTHFPRELIYEDY